MQGSVNTPSYIHILELMCNGHLMQELDYDFINCLKKIIPKLV